MGRRRGEGEHDDLLAWGGIKHPLKHVSLPHTKFSLGVWTNRGGEGGGIGGSETNFVMRLPVQVPATPRDEYVTDSCTYVDTR